MPEDENKHPDPTAAEPNHADDPEAAQAPLEDPEPPEREKPTEAGAADSPLGDQADDEDQEHDGEREKPAKELPPEALALCRSAIEAMLFGSAEPVASRKLAGALSDIGIDGRRVRKLIRDLEKEYAESQRGFAIEEVAGGFQMLTRPEYAEYVGRLHGGGGHAKLSQAALETLAVVAYKQPVTRADIEAIRGVHAGPLLRALLHKGLIKITGRAEILGRPLLYGTTRKFLEHFGLKSLNELPRVEELPKP